MHRSHLKYAFLLLFLAVVLSGCYRMRASKGGGQTKSISEKRIDPTDIALPKGCKIELIASGLNYPTGIDFDETGIPYIIESGYAYGEEWATPMLKRIEEGGSTTVIAKGEKNGPWNGVSYHDGHFYKFQVRHGLGMMPAFSEAHISDQDLQNIVQYMAALKRNK